MSEACHVQQQVLLDWEPTDASQVPSTTSDATAAHLLDKHSTKQLQSCCFA
jgi:hypothetical protein